MRVRLHCFCIFAAYGWTDMFPIEVSKGQVLELNIGYLKGSPSVRRVFNVGYNEERKLY